MPRPATIEDSLNQKDNLSRAIDRYILITEDLKKKDRLDKFFFDDITHRLEEVGKLIITKDLKRWSSYHNDCRHIDKKMLAAQLIFSAFNEKSTCLDLSQLGLLTLPKSLKMLRTIKTLILINNPLSFLEDSNLRDLTELKELYVDDDVLVHLPKKIHHLVQSNNKALPKRKPIQLFPELIHKRKQDLANGTSVQLLSRKSEKDPFGKIKASQNVYNHPLLEIPLSFELIDFYLLEEKEFEIFLSKAIDFFNKIIDFLAEHSYKFGGFKDLVTTKILNHYYQIVHCFENKRDLNQEASCFLKQKLKLTGKSLLGKWVVLKG